MMDVHYDFELIKDNAVISISDNDDSEVFTNTIKKIFSDSKFKSNLISNQNTHLQRYFSHSQNASKILAEILLDFKNN
jgi:hypothetical protein